MTVSGRVDWPGKGPFWFNMENIFDEDYYVDGSVWPGDAVPGTPAPNYDPVIGTLGQPRRLTADLRAGLW